MNTGTWIAITLAVVVALAFMFFGSGVFTSEPLKEVTLSPNQESSSQLMNTDTAVGTGTEVAEGSTVTVSYVGRFEDGRVFDASANHGGSFTFTLGVDPVIEGWKQGLIGMKEGGKRTLTVPPELGYGPNQYGPIPGNSTLIFEIELLKVE